MSRKRTTYSAEFKSRLVLGVLKNDKTLQEIASANSITPKKLEKDLLRECRNSDGTS